MLPFALLSLSLCSVCSHSTCNWMCDKNGREGKEVKASAKQAGKRTRDTDKQHWARTWTRRTAAAAAAAHSIRSVLSLVLNPRLEHNSCISCIVAVTLFGRTHHSRSQRKLESKFNRFSVYFYYYFFFVLISVSIVGAWRKREKKKF